MKFLSLKTLRENAFHSLLRFPLALLFAFGGTIVSVIMVGASSSDLEGLGRVLLTCFLGLPCLLGCHLYAERTTSKFQKLLLPIVGLIAVAIYGFCFAPVAGIFRDVKTSIIFFVLNICMHLWVALAPYMGKKELLGFWRFNEVLFSRFVLTVIFSGVLYGGLSLSLLSIDKLFGLDINDDYYGKLFLVVAGVFNTWFFLSGIPKDYKEINVEKVFPKGLKVFTQYILIPLAILYMLILYAYGFKIIAQGSLPKGWVSMLVMCYSLVGILATLLVYPLRDKAENAWVKFFAKFFFIAILPLVVLLFVAIGARIGDYGITELRYYLVLLGSWLAVISLYFVFSKQKNIKLIPLSLFILGLLSLFGPWNVFSISHNSQFSRLEQIYTKYEMVSEGQPLAKPVGDMDKDDAREVSNIIGYLVEMDYLDKLSVLYQTDIGVIKDIIMSQDKDVWYYERDLTDTLLTMANIDVTSKSSRNRYKYYNVEEEEDIYSYSLKGYSEIAKINYWNSRNYGKDREIKLANNVVFTFVLSEDNGAFLVKKEEEVVAKINLFNHFKQVMTNVEAGYVPIEYMQIEGKGEVKVKMVIRSIGIDLEKSAIREVSHLEADLLFE